MVFGSCASKRKTVSNVEKELSGRINTVTESIRKEIRNPEALLLLGDRITRNGEYFQPIDRVLRVSENRGELRLSVDSLGAVTVSYTAPADTVSVITEKEKKQVIHTVSENRSEKTSRWTKVPLGWIFLFLFAVLLILHRAYKKYIYL